MKEEKEIKIQGIVQGVGFRPFIYNLAKRHNLSGIVYNTTEGVIIRVQGSNNKIKKFIDAIKIEKPPLSQINSISARDTDSAEYKNFTIGMSSDTNIRSAYISPDVTLCCDCKKEYFSTDNYRYHYPFITCINCGPRFSIVNDIPYDRHNITMSGFKMCNQCNEEYNNPENRRFHAQPIACSICGPRMSLFDNSKKLISSDIDDIVNKTLEYLNMGNVIAIKGVGGFLLAVDAANDVALEKLRVRKGRPFKPFALMAGSIEKIEEFLHINNEEREALLSKERPIVLLKQKKEIISSLVAPGLSYIGIMLPYTPLMEHLFSLNREMILVMTSGNISEDPIAYKDDDAFDRLKNIADYFVTYNREISAHTDDSVIFIEEKKPYFIRRSRGYVPVPFKSENTKGHIIATGADIKNSFALAKDDMIILSQYLGDLATLSGNRLFHDTLKHFKHIYALTPEIVVADKHPGYFTTKIAKHMEKNGLTRVDVQHHHAHITSVMEEHNLHEKVIGVAYDGTGYGTDGTLWGSEFLITDRSEFIRAAHFSNFLLPGGESAIKDVWKIGISLLYKTYGRNIPIMKRDMKSEIILDILEKKVNTPETCSIGRIFDGVAAILGISLTTTSEAEAAMLLEEAALRGSMRLSGEKEALTPLYKALTPIQNGKPMEIDTSILINYIVNLMKKNYDTDEIAYLFHESLVYTTVEILEILREEYSINTVALSGGVFQNRLFLTYLMKKLTEKKFVVYTNNLVPANDGCIALGQIAVGKELFR